MDPSSEAADSFLGATKRNDDYVKEPKYSWLTPTVMNTIAGTTAGLAGVITGHPFDTVKVRLQNQSLKGSGAAVYGGTFSAFRTIIKEESIAGLFKGLSSPLVGVSIINAFLFGVYGYLLDVQQTFDGNKYCYPTVNQVFWAGAGSGFINSFISGPSELAKIQLQIQTGKKSSASLKGPMDCLRMIYRKNGIKGCFRGMTSTIIRETPSYGVYFASFEVLQRKFVANHSSSDQSRLAKSLKLMVAGGLSGVLGWISTYPIDVIKTKIQAQPIGQSPQFTGIIDCFRKLVASDGLSSLWRGLTPTIIRAFPSNAVIFLTYTLTIEALDTSNYPVINTH